MTLLQKKIFSRQTNFYWPVDHSVLPTFFLSLVLLSSCSKPNDPATTPVTPKVTPPPAPFDINQLNDTYPQWAPFDLHTAWGPYNTHDPSILNNGDYFYCYSTDAAYGIAVPPGIQIRRSKDLVEWEFVGWVFSGLPAAGANFIKQNKGTPNNGLWAPYIMKVGTEYRLYYSLSSPQLRLSVIGLATASLPNGPWVEKGLVVTSLNDNSLQTNAIDPTVVVAPTGEHWMYYGSAWDGIYILALDPSTGLAKTSGDIGKRIAQRGFTAGKINGNIEGAEIIYNPTQKKYYLFIAYDWLETKYNVRVGRADSPQGPFLDFNGHDINLEEDHGPMIIAPYQFEGHGGWQGTSHCSVFQNNGQFYIAHQGRPGVNLFFMVLHVRKLFWTKDGWPIASPERYAATEQTVITQTELTGAWERIELGYTVVPGYSVEQTSPNFQVAIDFNMAADGSINGDASKTWSYRPPWILFHSNSTTDSAYVERERDWENKKASLIFTGLNSAGTAVWGKKK
jgi:arabinan endo-1,5-alpha-L-arabinosidase